MGESVRDTRNKDLVFVWQGLRMINDGVTLAIAETSMKNVLNVRKAMLKTQATTAPRVRSPRRK
jgi:hypothetical protein